MKDRATQECDPSSMSVFIREAMSCGIAFFIASLENKCEKLKPKFFIYVKMRHGFIPLPHYSIHRTIRLRLFYGERSIMNGIIDLLDIEDENIIIKEIRIEGKEKFIHLETELRPHYCPACGAKMYSRGVKKRTIRHSILQDGYRLVVILNQRRWRCTNELCLRDKAETFKFVSPYKQTSNATDLLVVEQFRNVERTAADIGRQFNISDHQAIDIFEQYVDMKRLPLPDILSVDEVYMDMDAYCKYVLILQDFRTGKPVDMIISRRKNITEPYFMAIPREERLQVKYLVSDMYSPYLDYVNSYFPNAAPAVDSFHVMQWIIHQLDMFLTKLMKEYKKRDEDKAEALSKQQGRMINLPVSDEVYLLQNFRWIILKNQDEIDYSFPHRRDRHFGYVMDTYSYEAKFFALHKDLSDYRMLKEHYVHFNKTYAGKPTQAAEELDRLIDYYLGCEYEIFADFGALLAKYRQPIINSFILAEKLNSSSRLSNGPIESLNRKAKDMKRNCRGFENFEHMRNRFLFATRSDAPLTPKPSKYCRMKENQDFVDPDSLS